MTDKHQKEPVLVFFRETPRELLTRPPLASSLQHLETSFLLIAIWRYPHALLSCASAVESAIKAAFNIGEKSGLRFEELLNRAREHFPAHADFAQPDLDEFRRKRNQIIHYGFSPKDDEISAVLLLKTGYRLLEQCYQTFFQFPLQGKRGNLGGLLPDLADQLDIARKVYLKAKEEEALKLTYCFTSFAHTIRWVIKHWMMSDWEMEILQSHQDNDHAAWEYRHEEKETLLWRTLDPAWLFNCPICKEPESFVCELDGDKLEESHIELKRGVCVNCSLVIAADCPFLADELCADQIDQVRPKILKDFHIV